ncbi:MAG: hypothetical protein WD042_09065 [Phycisphaeraceae bacterium]
MALYNFHRVLISAAILFFFAFGLYAFKASQVVSVEMGIGSMLISVAMVAYLIYFNYRVGVINRS